MNTLKSILAAVIIAGASTCDPGPDISDEDLYRAVNTPKEIASSCDHLCGWISMQHHIEMIEQSCPLPKNIRDQRLTHRTCYNQCVYEMRKR